jgi:hypothetical protein
MVNPLVLAPALPSPVRKHSQNVQFLYLSLTFSSLCVASRDLPYVNWRKSRSGSRIKDVKSLSFLCYSFSRSRLTC